MSMRECLSIHTQRINTFNRLLQHAVVAHSHNRDFLVPFARQIRSSELTFRYRKRLLFLRLLQFLFPLLDAGVRAAEGKEFFLVVNQLLAREAGERIVFLQEDRLLRADFLAIAAEDAAEHVDLTRE